ncbi:hypothetical protein [Streptomyces syringium]|uniref:hypothetical protein n=1 Tax=Streptomyces syringium TaxID=76729 RepID=UPI003454D6C8
MSPSDWFTVGLLASAVTYLAAAELLARHRRALHIRAVLDARTAAQTWPEEQFLLGGDLDDYTATGIHDLDLYLRKEAEQ